MTVCVLIAYPCLAELLRLREKRNEIRLANKEVRTGREGLLVKGEMAPNGLIVLCNCDRCETADSIEMISSMSVKSASCREV